MQFKSLSYKCSIQKKLAVNDLTWMRICVEKPRVQELFEVCNDTNVHQLSHIVCLRLAQFLPLYPLSRQNPPGSVLCVCSGHDHLDTAPQQTEMSSIQLKDPFCKTCFHSIQIRDCIHWKQQCEQKILLQPYKDIIFALKNAKPPQRHLLERENSHVLPAHLNQVM